MDRATRAATLLYRTVDNPYIPIDHTPSPRQWQFLLLDDLEAFYGGQAGGGKSECLLMAALQYVMHPHYAALLFRRSYTDLALPGALMDRAHEWLDPTDAEWRDRDKTWLFPSGATLTFGYMESDRDRWRYQSSEVQYIAFDEVTEFSRVQYAFMFSRLRRLGADDIPLRMRSASNPGGPGHDWVKRDMVDNPAVPFIPASRADNPALDHDSYSKALDQLDPVTRAQLRDGDWSIRPDTGLFQRDWFEVVGEAPADADRVRYWDLAASEAKDADDPDYTAGVKLAMKDGVYYVEDVRHVRLTPQRVEKLVAQTAAIDGPEVRIGMEEEPGASGKGVTDYYRRHVLRGYAFDGIRSTGSKYTRALPVVSAAEAGNVKLVRGPWIAELLDELETLEGHDDQQDALSGGFGMLQRTGASVEIW